MLTYLKKRGNISRATVPEWIPGKYKENKPSNPIILLLAQE